MGGGFRRRRRLFLCGNPPQSQCSAVDSLRDLEVNVLPFFERHPLVVKQEDFRSFAVIVRMMRRKEHLTAVGFERAVRLAYAMNALGKQRARSLDEILTGSSETARWARSQEAPFLRP